MHAGFQVDTSNGPLCFQEVGSDGSANRSGGAANGIPRNLFAILVDESSVVVMATMVPSAMVTTGGVETAVGKHDAEPSKRRSAVNDVIELYITKH